MPATTRPAATAARPSATSAAATTTAAPRRTDPAVQRWLEERQRLSKESRKLLQQYGTLLSELPEISQERHRMARALTDSMAQIQRKVTQQKASVANLQSSLRKMILKGEDVQRLLEDIEASLTGYKRTMHTEYERLLLEEAKLSAELEEAHRDLINLENQDESGVRGQRAREAAREQTQREVEKDLAQKAALGAIEKQLAELGRLGGWDARDHDVFLKYWTQLRMNAALAPHGPTSASEGTDAATAAAAPSTKIFTDLERLACDNFCRKVVKFLPAMDLEAVEEHVKWFVKHTRLTQAKKELVDEWRRQKKVESEQQIAAELEAEGIDSPSRTTSAGTRPASAARYRGGLSGMEGPAGLALSEAEAKEEERRLVKEKIDRWKALRAQEQKEKQDSERVLSEKEERKREAERRVRQDEIRQQLAKWKIEEQQKEESAQKTPKRPASADPAEMNRRRQRDLETAKTRLQKVESKAKELTARQTKQRQMEEEISQRLFQDVQRDFGRLQTSTKASTASQITKEDLESAGHKRGTAGAHEARIAMSGRDLRFGVRATPAWLRPANY